MRYVVYADIIFGWIFIINILTYYITCMISRNKISILRLILWCLISSILFLNIYIFFACSNKGLYNLLYPCISFLLFILFWKFFLKKNCLTGIIKLFLYYILGIFILAGVIMFFMKNAISNKALMPVIFIVCIIITLLFNKYSIRKTDNIFQIEIHTNNQVIITLGYMDTGNTLLDIYSKKPVIILDYRLIQSILTADDKNIIDEYTKTGNYEHVASLVIDNQPLHPICYKTISEEACIMPAFNIKQLVINKHIYKNIVAAISRNKLSCSNEYMVLLNNNL